MKKQILLLAATLTAMVACNNTPETTNYACSDKEATEATQHLYNTLHKSASVGVLLGHQDDLAYGIGWSDEGTHKSDVEMVCGDYPALFGWDLGHLERGDDCNLDSVPFKNMRENAIWIAQNGGINTFSWHARNPLTEGDSWDVSSDKVVASIISGGQLHDKFLGWLDKVADLFLSLRDEKGELIPVIFRPFHELSGSWFWWGKNLCSPEEYKALWRQSVDYLRSKGCHNMLLSYSMADYKSLEEFLERYPGDDYVDIVGFDIYHTTTDYFLADMAARSAIAREYAKEHSKIWAVCECGYEAIPDDDWFTTVLSEGVLGNQCSHFLLWRNAINRPNHFYASYPGHSSAEDMKRFADREDVLTMREFSKLLNE